MSDDDNSMDVQLVFNQHVVTSKKIGMDEPNGP